MSNINVVADIGQNHQGDTFTALHMANEAITCGATVVKSQKRHPKSMPQEKYDQPYENPHSFGKTYGEHRERLELPLASHHLLSVKCRERGALFTDSVWDRESLQEVLALDLPYLKIPSALNNAWEFLKAVATEFKGPVHVSNGMTSLEDERRLVKMFAGRIVLYACTSAYPAEFKDVKLLDIVRFGKEYGGDLLGVGFSGHHRGIALDVVAVAMGATWIERHFTLDRTMKGSDHAASLEPPGLAKMCRDIHAVLMSLDYRNGVLDCEKAAYAKLKGIKPS